MLKKIIQYIGLTFTLISVFLGLLYITKGDLMISFVISSVMVVILFFLIDFFIQRKTQIVRNNKSFLAVFLSVLYVSLSIPLTFFVVHCFNVEINEKKEIQSLGNAKLSALKKMTDDYHKKSTSYLNIIETELNSKLIQYRFNSNKNSTAIELQNRRFNLSPVSLKELDQKNITITELKIKASQLLNTKFEDKSRQIEIDNETFIKQYGNVFDNWSWLKLNNVFYELDNLLAKNELLLNSGFSSITYPSQTFSYSYPKSSPLMDDPIALWQKHSPYYLFLIVILYQILILLPYFLQETPGRYGDSIFTKIYKKLTGNETTSSVDEPEDSEGGFRY